MAIFPGEPGLASTRMSPFWIVLEPKVDGGGGDNWSYKSCKAPVKSTPPTNHNPSFYKPDALPVTQPTVSEHCSYCW